MSINRFTSKVFLAFRHVIDWQVIAFAVGVTCIALALMLAVMTNAGAQSPATTLPQIELACSGAECADGAQYPYIKHSDALRAGTIPANVQTQKG